MLVFRYPAVESLSGQERKCPGGPRFYRAAPILIANLINRDVKPRRTQEVQYMICWTLLLQHSTRGIQEIIPNAWTCKRPTLACAAEDEQKYSTYKHVPVFHRFDGQSTCSRSGTCHPSPPRCRASRHHPGHFLRQSHGCSRLVQHAHLR